MLYTYSLSFPPSVNNYYAHTKRGVFIKKAGREFRAKVEEEVVEQGRGQRLSGKIIVEVVLFAPDKRRRDLDNFQKGLLDALTHAHVWIDDSQIDQLFVYRGSVVKNGMAMVSISEAGPVMSPDFWSKYLESS